MLSFCHIHNVRRILLVGVVCQYLLVFFRKSFDTEVLVFPKVRRLCFGRIVFPLTLPTFMNTELYPKNFWVSW